MSQGSRLTPRLIGISGYARSGKTTLSDAFAQLGYGVVSFAEPIKQMLLALDPIADISGMRLGHVLHPSLGYCDTLENAKDHFPEVRRLLQRLGTEAGRGVLGENIWVDTAMRNTLDGGRYVFPDCRFLNEAAAIRDAGGIVIKVERPGVEPLDHISDTGIDDITFDYVLHNDGSTEALKAQAEVVLSKERLLRISELSERELFMVDL